MTPKTKGTLFFAEFMTALFSEVFAARAAATAKTVLLGEESFAPPHDEITGKVIAIMVAAVFICAAVAAALIFINRSK